MSAPKPAPFQPAALSEQGENGSVQPVMPSPVPPALKPKRQIPAFSNQVLGAKISIAFRGEDGQIREAVYTVSSEEYVIEKYSLEEDKKYSRYTDPSGDTESEDTGVRQLIFKLRYHVK